MSSNKMEEKLNPHLLFHVQSEMHSKLRGGGGNNSYRKPLSSAGVQKISKKIIWWRICLVCLPCPLQANCLRSNGKRKERTLRATHTGTTPHRLTRILCGKNLLSCCTSYAVHTKRVVDDTADTYDTCANEKGQIVYCKFCTKGARWWKTSITI